MIVASFPKNSSQEVRAQLGEYLGQPVVSLWVFADSRSGPVATRHGLSLGVAALPQLEDAVHKLRLAAAAAGHHVGETVSAPPAGS